MSSVNKLYRSIRVVAVAFLLLSGSAGFVEAKSACPPTQARSQSWLQDELMTHEGLAGIRASLGLSHLEGQQVVPLGSDPEDEAVCAELYSRLMPSTRAVLEQPGPRDRVEFYRVGDRYLSLLQLAGHLEIGHVYVTSYDLQFNEIDMAV